MHRIINSYQAVGHTAYRCKQLLISRLKGYVASEDNHWCLFRKTVCCLGKHGISVAKEDTSYTHLLSSPWRVMLSPRSSVQRASPCAHQKLAAEKQHNKANLQSQQTQNEAQGHFTLHLKLAGPRQARGHPVLQPVLPSEVWSPASCTKGMHKNLTVELKLVYKLRNEQIYKVKFCALSICREISLKIIFYLKVLNCSLISIKPQDPHFLSFLQHILFCVLSICEKQ